MYIIWKCLVEHIINYGVANAIYVKEIAQTTNSGYNMNKAWYVSQYKQRQNADVHTQCLNVSFGSLVLFDGFPMCDEANMYFCDLLTETATHSKQVTEAPPVDPGSKEFASSVLDKL